MSKEYFSIQEAIEQYGIKNLRVMLSVVPVDFTFFAMTGIPLTLQSSNDNEVWAEYKIEECYPSHKINFVPSEKYDIKVTEGGQETGRCNLFPNERKYMSDFDHTVTSGGARVYVETEDGYQLICGAYTDLYDDKRHQLLNWLSNFFNFNSVQSFA